MKMTLRTFTLMILVLTLTACGAGASRSIPTLAPQTDAAGMTTDYANAISIESQLLVGTFKLEDTDKAVSAKQADDLAAYWQLLKDLTTSGSAAQEEIDATVEAIEAAMTPDQLKTIASMNLTRQDMFTILRQQGGASTFGNASNGGNQNPGTQRNFNFGPPDGFGGGGGFAGGGGGFGNQQNNTNRSSNNQSTSGSTSFSSRVPSALLDAVITLLKGKTLSS